MADGGIFHQYRITAASRQYPLGSILRVESVQTGKSILVTVTDRGPWCKKFSLDLSKAAFREIGLNPRAGWGIVSIERFTE
jgi:rare lipoprotein A